jgi:hypothetical protein
MKQNQRVIARAYAYQLLRRYNGLKEPKLTALIHVVSYMKIIIRTQIGTRFLSYYCEVCECVINSKWKF